MKIEFYCDNGANMHSCRSETFSIQDLGFTKEEWDMLTDDDKLEMAKEWAFEKFDYGFHEDGK